jgi:leucyl aminopeptidase
MSESIKIDYTALASLDLQAPLPSVHELLPGTRTGEGPKTLVIFVGPGLALGAATKSLLGAEGGDLIKRASAAAKFKGKPGQTLDIVAPAGLSASRLLVIGTGAEANGEASKETESKPFDPVTLGGTVAGKLGQGAQAVILVDFPRAAGDLAKAAGDFVLGLRLRDYKFDLYKTKKKDDTEEDTATSAVLAVADVAAARTAAAAVAPIADGVLTARSLVNEPANILTPEVFAERAKALEALGVEVTTLDEDAMKALGMGAFLGVSQGSVKPGRIVILRWNGLGPDAPEGHQPLAFVGKGVTFDTGGISIKGASGMEDMKGDMAGAACVTGLMQALAGRKAKVDVIGALGLVENMPGPDAQRPGDIVTSMSGQTIEIINTDAEGRLVLADVCWYVQDKFKPKFIVDLATLTGAILVALGQEHAGLFSNNDELSEHLTAAGKATGEKVWRMPLAPAYDKLIDSKFADMKNSGGRHAGSIAAAHFIQRFVNNTPWAHLDIAGMGMSSPANEINQSWGSGWGVRLLNRLVADYYEAR